MAEIISTDSSNNSKIPENQKDWEQGKSGKGEIYTFATFNDKGEKVDKKKDTHTVDASGPAFQDYKVTWNPDGQIHQTDDKTKDVTGIWQYQFITDFPATAVAPGHYTLTIWTNKSYNYTFFSAVDSYSLDVYVTAWSHWLGMTTFDPTITSISGV